jgi:cell division protein FtsB
MADNEEELNAAKHDAARAERERDTAQTRVKELEAGIAQATAQISAQAGELGKLYAERDALKERAAKAEDDLLKLRAAKCLDAMDANAERAALEDRIRAGLANLSSAGIRVERAADPTHAELAQIWELWGAGRPQTPGSVYEAAQDEERLGSKLASELRQITERLDGEGFPAYYGEDERGGPVPLPDRVGMLLTLTDRLQAEALAWRADAGKAEAELFAAHKELADLGSPRFAGGQLLTVAHRIRALPGLLRQE